MIKLEMNEIASVSGATALGAAAGAWVGAVAGAAIFVVADAATAGLATPAGGLAITGGASVGASIGGAISDLF